MNKRNLIIMTAILLLAVVAFILGYMLFPETIAVQYNLSGEVGNTLPKLIGLLIPFAICCVFAVLYYKSGNAQHIVFACLGIFLFMLEFIINLKH